jgi:hypothetical protein
MILNKYGVYLSGPMRNLPLYNFPAFDDARDVFKAAGFEVFSPADHDREMGFDPTKDPTAEFSSLDPWTDFALWDLSRVNDADVIYCLKGWELSMGANVEVDLAKWLNGMTGGKVRLIVEQSDDTVKDVATLVKRLISPPYNRGPLKRAALTDAELRVISG